MFERVPRQPSCSRTIAAVPPGSRSTAGPCRFSARVRCRHVTVKRRQPTPIGRRHT